MCTPRHEGQRSPFIDVTATTVLVDLNTAPGRRGDELRIAQGIGHSGMCSPAFTPPTRAYSAVADAIAEPA